MDQTLRYWFVVALCGALAECEDPRADAIEAFAARQGLEIYERGRNRRIVDYVLAVPIERAASVFAAFASEIGFLWGAPDFVEYGNVDPGDPRLPAIDALLRANGSYLSE